MRPAANLPKPMFKIASNTSRCTHLVALRWNSLSMRKEVDLSPERLEAARWATIEYFLRAIGDRTTRPKLQSATSPGDHLAVGLVTPNIAANFFTARLSGNLELRRLIHWHRRRVRTVFNDASSAVRDMAIATGLVRPRCSATSARDQ